MTRLVLLMVAGMSGCGWIQGLISDRETTAPEQTAAEQLKIPSDSWLLRVKAERQQSSRRGHWDLTGEAYVTEEQRSEDWVDPFDGVGDCGVFTDREALVPSWGESTEVPPLTLVGDDGARTKLSALSACPESLDTALSTCGPEVLLGTLLHSGELGPYDVEIESERGRVSIGEGLVPPPPLSHVRREPSVTELKVLWEDSDPSSVVSVAFWSDQEGGRGVYCEANDRGELTVPPHLAQALVGSKDLQMRAQRISRRLRAIEAGRYVLVEAIHSTDWLH